MSFRLTHFRNKDTSNGYSLQMALGNTFSSHGLFCYFKPREMFNFITKLDDEMRTRCRETGQSCEKHLLTTAGRQGDFVFLSPSQIVDLNTGTMVSGTVSLFIVI